MSEQILKEFDAKQELYASVASKASSLIIELIKSYGINVHSVTFRAKERRSLARKLSKQGRNYLSLADITDMAGVRIVTYFEGDVSRVVEVIEREFCVDVDNSIDKGQMLDPDRFGYVSTHHVVGIKEARKELNEYKWFGDARFEIQTRSILQHAWAEIEHDLGYKTKNEIPKHIRRKFSRLAGLLELADSEFNTINSELSAYDRSLAATIQDQPSRVEIDRSSLIAFVKSSSLVTELDRFVAAAGGWTLELDEDRIGKTVEYLLFAGVITIADLQRSLNEHHEQILNFVKPWLLLCEDDDDFDERQETTMVGVSLFYLLYVSFAAKGDTERLAEYLKAFSIGRETPEELANQVLATFEKSIATK